MQLNCQTEESAIITEGPQMHPPIIGIAINTVKLEENPPLGRRLAMSILH